jgi:hypothetical protein
MKEFFQIVGLVGMALFGILGGVALVAGLALLPFVIAWLLWNKALAPAFGWPHFGFWVTFAVLWFASFISKLVFGRGRKE